MVIPVELYSAVQVATPVFKELVFLPDAFDEVVSMLFSHIFYAEIIDDKCESNWPPFMPPESRHVGTFMGTVGGKAFLQEFVGKYAGLG